MSDVSVAKRSVFTVSGMTGGRLRIWGTEAGSQRKRQLSKVRSPIGRKPSTRGKKDE